MRSGPQVSCTMAVIPRCRARPMSEAWAALQSRTQRILEGGTLPVARRRKLMLTGLGICTALSLGLQDGCVSDHSSQSNGESREGSSEL